LVGSRCIIAFLSIWLLPYASLLATNCKQLFKSADSKSGRIQQSSVPKPRGLPKPSSFSVVLVINLRGIGCKDQLCFALRLADVLAVLQAVQTMVAMMEEGIMPDKVAATALVQACIQAGDTKRAESIFSRFFGKDGAVGCDS
jgi:hypothetical protein